MNWIVPPVYLVGRVLQHMANCKAKGTLVVSRWYSASFWPLLCPGGRYVSEIKDIMYLPVNKESYTQSRSGGLFGVEDLKFPMLALYIDYCE